VITREDVLEDGGGEKLGRVVTREDVFSDEPVGRKEDEVEGEALGDEVLADICGKYKNKNLRGNASLDF